MLKVPKELKEHEDLRVLRVQLQEDHKVLLARILVGVDHKVLKVDRDSKERLDLKVRQVPLVFKALKDLQGLLLRRAQKDLFVLVKIVIWHVLVMLVVLFTWIKRLHGHVLAKVSMQLNWIVIMKNVVNYLLRVFNIYMIFWILVMSYSVLVIV